MNNFVNEQTGGKMTEEQKEKLDLWGDWEPIVLEEQDAPDFSKPIRGKYKAEITAVEYKEIHSEKTGEDYELINMKLKVTDDIEGDKSFSRMLDKAFFMGVSQYNDDPIAGYKSLLNCLKSSELYAEWMKSDNIRGNIEKMNEELLGKEVYITAFPKGDRQQIRIVKPKNATAKDDTPKSKFAV